MTPVGVPVCVYFAAIFVQITQLNVSKKCTITACHLIPIDSLPFRFSFLSVTNMANDFNIFICLQSDDMLLGYILKKTFLSNMSETNSMLEGIVDEIWEDYDKDNSGFLDKAEVMQFLKDSAARLSEGFGGDQEVEVDEESFEEAFTAFDKDGSGTMAKSEMVNFMNALYGSVQELQDEEEEEEG